MTDRERQVMRLVCQGHTPKEIAAHLNLSLWTVKDHMRNASRRLGARNGKHAVALFLEAS
jgi:DNA-binding CsgD family transcriptional regulator